jgi:hypothetical protein
LPRRSRVGVVPRFVLRRDAVTYDGGRGSSKTSTSVSAPQPVTATDHRDTISALDEIAPERIHPDSGQHSAASARWGSRTRRTTPSRGRARRSTRCTL